MGIRDAWRALWARPETKASAAGPAIALQLLGRPIWTSRDYEQAARESYCRNPIAYAAIRRVSMSVAGVRAYVAAADGEEIESHPLLTLLRRPNKRSSWRALTEAVIASRMIAGNAYVERVDGVRDVLELHHLRSDRVKIVLSANGDPARYEYTASGRTVTYEAETPRGSQILHLREFNPINDVYGLSPVDPAAYDIDTHTAAQGWNKAMLDNQARPSGALVFNGPEGQTSLSDDQFRRLKDQIEDNYSGAKNAGRPMLLEGGLDWKEMGLSPKDMEFLEGQHNAARNIARVFGVPPMLLGIPGDATYSNYQEANSAFWRDTVIPMTEDYLEELSAWLGPLFGGVTIKADWDQCPALTPERDALWKRVNDSDFLTLDEKRAAVGYEPVEGGDVILVPGSDVPLSMAGGVSGGPEPTSADQLADA